MSALAQDGELVLGALRGAASAAATAVLVLAAAARPWSALARRERALRAFGAPLAVGLATAAGFWSTRGRPSLPPTQALHWLFYAALVGAAYGAVEGRLGRGALIARASLAALLPVVLLGFQRARHWGPLEGVAWTAGLAALLYAGWNAVALLETRGVAGSAATLGWALASALASGAYALAGGALFAQLAGALALGLGACAVLGWRQRTPGLGAGGAAPYALVHSGLLWSARYLYELGAAAFVLLALVPLSALATRAAAAWRPRLAAPLALGLPVALAAGALLAEWLARPPSLYG